MQVVIVIVHALFLSTLSLRRATTHPIGVLVRIVISIHALLAESDNADIKTPHFTSYFYPRSPCGERRDVIAVMTDAQSISIHALLAESDRLRFSGTAQHTYFYPRSPCGERQGHIKKSPCKALISIHALLAESDPKHPKSISCKLNFYPRSPCGERHSANKNLTQIHHFYPRSPCGERHLLGFKAIKFKLFLSTLSLRRATREPTALRTPHHIFLSTLSLRRATYQQTAYFLVSDDFYPRSPCGERLA